MSDESSAESSAPAKKPLKLIMLIAAAVLVLGTGGTGTWLFLKKRAAAKAAAAEMAKAAQPQEGAGGEAPESEDQEGCGEADGKEEGGHGSEPSPVMVLTRTVNLAGPRRNAFLRCELNILFCDKELGKLASGDKPSPEKSLIQSIALNALAGRTVEEASDPESREALRLEIKDKLNEAFKPHPPKEGEKEDPKHKKPKRSIRDVLIVDWAIQQ